MTLRKMEKDENEGEDREGKNQEGNYEAMDESRVEKVWRENEINRRKEESRDQLWDGKGERERGKKLGHKEGKGGKKGGQGKREGEKSGQSKFLIKPHLRK